MSIQVLPVEEKEKEEKKKKVVINGSLPTVLPSPTKSKNIEDSPPTNEKEQLSNNGSKSFSKSVSSFEGLNKKKRRKIHTSHSGGNEFVKRGKTIFRKNLTRKKIGGSTNEIRGISFKYKGK